MMQTRIVIVLACLLATAVVVIRADRQEEVPLRASFDTFPMQLGEWRGVAVPRMSEQAERVLGADDYVTRAYIHRERTGVGLFIGYWKSQRQGDTIHSPMNCLPGSGWEPMASRHLTFPDPRQPQGPALTVNRVTIQKGLEKQLVLYWYQSHGRIVASEYWGRFYLMADAMRLNRTDGSIVRVIAPVGDGADAEARAEASALRFIGELLPRLESFLPS